MSETVLPPLIYTLTDEAPALATASLLPVIRSFCATAGIPVEERDISLAGRIIAQFPDYLESDKQQPDALSELGELAKTPSANIIKLPNISASIPQLTNAIKELQQQGYALPDFPAEAENEEQQKIRERYSKVLGSAVNPVLREGNSDRRVAKAVKEYAKAHPHRMGEWTEDCVSRVAAMQQGDFFGSEQSLVMPADDSLTFELVGENGEQQTLKQNLQVQQEEVLDVALMSVEKLRQFYRESIETASKDGLLLSLHLKATMMKVSDPILFGHAVEIYFEDLFTKYRQTFQKLAVNPRNGLGELMKKIADLPEAEQQQIEQDIKAIYQQRPPLAMVDSDRGITNLHVPSDVIVDASMPAAIRTSGKMWGPDGKLANTLAMIPDRSYGVIYQQVMEDCRKHGKFDVTSMGSVSNVGLMAQKAEEYGSHDKTFEIPFAGTVRVITDSGEVLFENPVAQGDIWRMCQTKDLPIRDWVGLAVKRARLTNTPAVFWLDEKRAHDSRLIEKVKEYLPAHDTEGLEVHILPPAEAIQFSLKRIREGLDTISVTGNILRDYLTDLFPILELGTSAKMLSIVPLLSGGGLFETGAGGSAPKHVQQLLEENHLRWDSLGEFLAIAASLEAYAHTNANPKAAVLASCLDEANARILNENRSPSRKAGEPDTRSSHFYLTCYWAEALAEQQQDSQLAEIFAPVAAQLKAEESAILEHLIEVQGKAMDIGGYYHPEPGKTADVMRPSEDFNRIIDQISAA